MFAKVRNAMNEELIELFKRYNNHPSFLFEEKIISVNQTGLMGETLLNLAVISQSPKDVRLLLENGADVNAKGELEFTPIQNACIYGNLDIIDMLIKFGADVSAKNEFGYDARHYASEKCHDKKQSKAILLILRNTQRN